MLVATASSSSTSRYICGSCTLDESTMVPGMTPASATARWPHCSTKYLANASALSYTRELALTNSATPGPPTQPVSLPAPPSTVGNRKKPMLSRNSWDTVSSVVNCGSSHEPMSHMAACSVRNSALASALERALKPRLKAPIRTSRCTSAAAWIRPGCVNGMRPLMASLTTSGPAMRSARYMYQSDPVQRSPLPRAMGVTPLAASVSTTCRNSSYVFGTSSP